MCLINLQLLHHLPSQITIYGSDGVATGDSSFMIFVSYHYSSPLLPTPTVLQIIYRLPLSHRLTALGVLDGGNGT